MVIKIVRDTFTPTTTLGKLYVDCKLVCETLEPPVNENRRGLDAIPAGEYPCEVSYSPSFKRDTVELLNVPNRSQILIHSGNFPRDTRGCIIVAARRTADHTIWGDSKILEKKITEKVRENEGTTVLITNAENITTHLEEVKV